MLCEKHSQEGAVAGAATRSDALGVQIARKQPASRPAPLELALIGAEAAIVCAELGLIGAGELCRACGRTEGHHNAASSAAGPEVGAAIGLAGLDEGPRAASRVHVTVDLVLEAGELGEAGCVARGLGIRAGCEGRRRGSGRALDPDLVSAMPV